MEEAEDRERWPWLKERRDAEGRAPDDPAFDHTTILIPPHQFPRCSVCALAGAVAGWVSVEWVGDLLTGWFWGCLAPLQASPRIQDAAAYNPLFTFTNPCVLPCPSCTHQAPL